MVDYEFQDLFKQDSIEKQITIKYDNTVITNEDLFKNEMTLEESLCSESQLKFGSCEASMVKFKVANIFSPMIGKTLDIQVVLEGNTKNPFQYGFYKVQSDKLTADREWREIVAYDTMYDIINADVSDWYNSLFPNNGTIYTMRRFRKSFIEHFGLQEDDISLVNDNMTVTKTVFIQSEREENENLIAESNGLSGLDVISSICEINGCFGHIGRDGKFNYIYLPQAIEGLYPANDLYPDHAPDYLPWQQRTGHLYPQNSKSISVGEDGTYMSCHYEDYLCKTIDKLQIRQEENDIGVIVGRDGDNCYIIEDNFLVYGKGSTELQKIANNIFKKITDVVYRPLDADCKGNPCLEVGDPVRISTKYDIVESYILKRTLKGIQALRDSYSADGVEMYSEKVNSVHKSIVQLKGKSNVLERTIEETKSTLRDVGKGLQTQITQNAESITAEATRATSAEEKLSSRIQVTASDITAEVTRATDAEHTLSSQIQVTANSISSKVSKGDVVSEINQSPDTITLSSGRLVITSGNFALDSSGNVSMTGNVNATSGKIGVFDIGRFSLSGGETEINLTDVSTSNIRGRQLLIDEIRPTSFGGEILIGADDTYPCEKVRICAGGANSSWGVVFDKNSSNDFHLRPGYNGAIDCGSASYHWDNVYADNGTIITSDRNEKTNIMDMTESYAEQIIDGSIPKTYMMVNGSSGRTHNGLIAQDVEQQLYSMGLNTKDFAGIIMYDKEVEDVKTGEIGYGLRYEEYIPIIIKYAQLLKSRVCKAEREYANMQEMFFNLQGEVSILKQKLGGINNVDI